MLFLVFIQLVLPSGRGNVRGDRNTRGLQRRLCFLLEDTKCGCFWDNGFIVVPVPGHVFCFAGFVLGAAGAESQGSAHHEAALGLKFSSSD